MRLLAYRGERIWDTREVRSFKRPIESGWGRLANGHSIKGEEYSKLEQFARGQNTELLTNSTIPT